MSNSHCPFYNYYIYYIIFIFLCKIWKRQHWRTSFLMKSISELSPRKRCPIRKGPRSVINSPPSLLMIPLWSGEWQRCKKTAFLILISRGVREWRTGGHGTHRVEMNAPRRDCRQTWRKPTLLSSPCDVHFNIKWI